MEVVPAMELPQTEGRVRLVVAHGVVVVGLFVVATIQLIAGLDQDEITTDPAIPRVDCPGQAQGGATPELIAFVAEDARLRSRLLEALDTCVHVWVSGLGSMLNSASLGARLV